MKLLDLSFPSPAENLACDEALLDFFEEHGGDGVLRFWEPRNYFVVLGYANEVAREVEVATCEADGIGIFRRCSGGGTVLQGPGCLNYSIIAPITEGGPLRSITSANRFIMERNREAIEMCRSRGAEARLLSKDQRLVSSLTIKVCGHTDLALVGGRRPLDTAIKEPSLQYRDRRDACPTKFSGNAQRRKKHFLLFHGTFLLNFDIPLVEKYLQMPSKQPVYRHGRSHKNFLTNLDVPAGEVKEALREAWNAAQGLEVAPYDAIALLARDKYVTKEWNFKF